MLCFLLCLHFPKSANSREMMKEGEGSTWLRVAHCCLPQEEFLGASAVLPQRRNSGISFSSKQRPLHGGQADSSKPSGEMGICTAEKHFFANHFLYSLLVSLQLLVGL